ncbi:MAG: TetR/AcrR family transcriptional regulator [Chloroflexi bacterium]|nr:TetR/AcrR family transcriptional regulator [Chloroflexota bacterium]
MPKVIDEESVFRAVMNIIVARGYENATTKDMAAAAGIHEATLFRKYENKMKLVALAIEKQFSMVSLAKLAYSGNLEADLRAIVQAYIDTYEMYGAIILTILTEIPRHPELAEAISIPLANTQNLIKIIVQHQTQGQLKQEPPLTSLSVLLGPLMINYMFGRANPDVPMQTIDPQNYVNAFLHGRATS